MKTLLWGSKYWTSPIFKWQKCDRSSIGAKFEWHLITGQFSLYFKIAQKLKRFLNGMCTPNQFPDRLVGAFKIQAQKVPYFMI